MGIKYTCDKCGCDITNLQQVKIHFEFDNAIQGSYFFILCTSCKELVKKFIKS